MASLFDLTGKVAFVTGAGGGIGGATARMLAEAGATLVLSDTPKACAAIQIAFPSARIVEADLKLPEASNTLANEALSRHGRIDILVCGAGIHGPSGSMAEASQSAIDQVMTVNLHSHLAICNIIAPAMAKAGGGSIVLVSSIAGIRGNRAIGIYGITKAALAQMARNLAVEWGPSGVRANAVSPGLIRTAFADSMIADATFLERRLSLTPLRRVGDTSEVASAILFLASDAGGFVTGHNLVVDGGTTISDGN
jgi:NAD(P)-dependent dehydrogenase (short-subunit alcohol dehydrogenase family)